jgi:hypothetical protein
MTSKAIGGCWRPTTFRHVTAQAVAVTMAMEVSRTRDDDANKSRLIATTTERPWPPKKRPGFFLFEKAESAAGFSESSLDEKIQLVLETARDLLLYIADYCHMGPGWECLFAWGPGSKVAPLRPPPQGLLLPPCVWGTCLTSGTNLYLWPRSPRG